MGYLYLYLVHRMAKASMADASIYRPTNRPTEPLVSRLFAHFLLLLCVCVSEC